jgi:hypothetical protein
MLKLTSQCVTHSSFVKHVKLPRTSESKYVVTEVKGSILDSGLVNTMDIIIKKFV